MGRGTRVPGPINLQTNMKQRRELIGRSEWISIDVTDGSWTANDPNSTLVSKAAAAAGMTDVRYEGAAIDTAGTALYSMAGDSTDPGGFYYIAATMHAEGGTAGTMSFSITYAVN